MSKNNIDGRSWEVIRDHNELAYESGTSRVSEVIEGAKNYWAVKTAVPTGAIVVEQEVKMEWRTVVFTEVEPLYPNGQCNVLVTEAETKKIKERAGYVVGSLECVNGWCGDGGDYISNSARYIWAEVVEVEGERDMRLMVWYDEYRARKTEFFEGVHLTNEQALEYIHTHTPKGYELIDWKVKSMYSDDYTNDGHIYTLLYWEAKTPYTHMPVVPVPCIQVLNFTGKVVRGEMPRSHLRSTTLSEAYFSRDYFPNEKMNIAEIRVALETLLWPSRWAQDEIYVILPKEGKFRKHLIAQISELVRDRTFGEMTWTDKIDSGYEIVLTGEIVIH